MKKIKRIGLAVFGLMLVTSVSAETRITYKSAKIISKIKKIEEFNIGHFLIGESINKSPSIIVYSDLSFSIT